jgi:4,5-dihydroxyphthalate decarboxylase
MTDRKTLKVLLGSYPATAPLKSGVVGSDRVGFDFVEINPVWDGFKGMIREQRYDVSEMAIVTYLLAKAHGKPFALLPAPLVGRFQHPYAIVSAGSGIAAPRDLNGKRVGIRSFTTTTGAWIRGILANDYDVELNSIRWITFEDPHVAEYQDTTERAPSGKRIVPMLLDGELDAVLGEQATDPRARTLFPDPAAEAQRWFAKHKIFPVNHFVIMRSTDVWSNPDLVREVWRLLLEAKKAATPDPSKDPLPFGIEASRASLDRIADYAYQQRLTPRRITVDEMFAETRDLLDQ